MARVLLVEDDPLILRAFSLILEKTEYEVFATAEPHQALAIVRNTHPCVDVVLSDVGLPEMQGTQLVREIAQISPHTAALLMTAGGLPAEVPPGVPVLQKPLSKADLLAAMNAALSVKTGKSEPGTRT